MSRELTTSLKRRNLDRVQQLGQLPTPPSTGWIAEIRAALGLPMEEVARRLGISRQSFAKLENHETDGAITLRKLDEVARSLGCRLVYGLIPETGTFEQMVKERARAIATQIVNDTESSMALEQQAVDKTEREARIVELTNKLALTPWRLWHSQ